MDAISRNNVLRLNPSVVVRVQRQKRLVHARKVAGNLLTNLLVKLLDASLEFNGELLLLQSGFRRFVDPPVEDGVFARQGHLGEKELTKLRKAQFALAALEDILQLEVGADLFWREV